MEPYRSVFVIVTLLAVGCGGQAAYEGGSSGAAGATTSSGGSGGGSIEISVGSGSSIAASGVVSGVSSGLAAGVSSGCAVNVPSGPGGPCAPRADDCSSPGIGCADGLACSSPTGGTCVPCSGGQTACGFVCVNEQTDPYNCGGCGVVCAEESMSDPALTCQNGTCVPIADASADASDDGTAPSEAGDAGTPPRCAPGGPGNSIAFDLTTDATGPVYYGGAQGEGWLDSFGCPSWLAIAPADEPALNLVKGGCAISCPAFAPEPALAQSFTWDGTYYPNEAVACTGIACACQTPVCAPPGNYVATICVGYGEADAGPPETAPPTCKQVPFVWPPTSADQSIVESITPTPDGG